MRSRILVAIVTALALATPMTFANPPAGGQMFHGGSHHDHAKKYVVWFRDPDDCRWQYYGTYGSRRAAEITAADIKHAHPSWQVRIDES